MHGLPSVSSIAFGACFKTGPVEMNYSTTYSLDVGERLEISIHKNLNFGLMKRKFEKNLQCRHVVRWVYGVKKSHHLYWKKRYPKPVYLYWQQACHIGRLDATLMHIQKWVIWLANRIIGRSHYMHFLKCTILLCLQYMLFCCMPYIVTCEP